MSIKQVNPQLLGDLADVFDDFLAERNILIPTSENEKKENHDTEDETGNEARIYGTDYGELEERLSEVLVSWAGKGNAVPIYIDRNGKCVAANSLEQVKKNLRDIIDKCTWDPDQDPYNSGALYGMKFALDELNKITEE